MTEKKVSPQPFGRTKDLIKPTSSGYESLARKRNLSPNGRAEDIARLKESLIKEAPLGMPDPRTGQYCEEGRMGIHPHGDDSFFDKSNLLKM